MVYWNSNPNFDCHSWVWSDFGNEEILASSKRTQRNYTQKDRSFHILSLSKLSFYFHIYLLVCLKILSWADEKSTEINYVSAIFDKILSPTLLFIAYLHRLCHLKLTIFDPPLSVVFLLCKICNFWSPSPLLRRHSLCPFSVHMKITIFSFMSVNPMSVCIYLPFFIEQGFTHFDIDLLTVKMALSIQRQQINMTKITIKCCFLHFCLKPRNQIYLPFLLRRASHTSILPCSATKCNALR